MATTTPRMKITYATLSADNEELQAAYDQRRRRGARRCSAGRYPMLIGGEERRRRRRPSRTARRSTPRSSSAASRSGRARTSGRDRRGARRVPGMARPRLADAARDPPPRRRPHQRAPVPLRGAHELRGRQEPPRGARRRRGDRRPASATTATPWSATTASCSRWARSRRSEHTRSVLKPHGVWAVISPFNFPMALSGGPAAGALLAGNTVVMKPSSDAPLMAYLFATVLREVGRAGRGRERGHRARATRSAPSWRRTPTSAAWSSPAATRSGCGSTRASPATTRARSSPRWAARTRPSSPATPTSTWRRRASCAPRSASTARSAAPTRASTSSARWRDAFVDKLAAQGEGRPRRRPHAARELDGAGHQRAVAPQVHRCGRRRRSATAAGIVAGGEVLRDADTERGYFPTPTVVTGLPLEPSPLPRRAVRAARGRRRGRLARRGARAGERQRRTG